MLDKSKNDVVIIDYGVGNLLSVMRGVEICGANPVLTNCPDKISNAERLILPGVGAFSDGMRGLSDKNLIEPIKDYCLKGRPFLGICLGMQMILDESHEFGVNKGLSLIPGKVLGIPRKSYDGRDFKIPHIGWSSIRPDKNSKAWQNTILHNTTKEDSVYFVHSFFALPENEENTLASCNYAGKDFCAVINKDNIYGCQFHPEKSGMVGIGILDIFCNEL
jgi:imidazole glycerol-phosphate synthase subunit HisH